VYAYADESGHTGGNLLDPAQPIYYSAAVMSLGDIDVKYGPAFNEYANQQGFDHLHAAEMGIHRLKDFLPRLTGWIKRDTIRFYIGKVDKRWFILCKLFDFLFDPVENRGARIQVYNVMPLRFLMLVKLSYIVDENDLREAWEAIRGSNVDESQKLFMSVLRRISSHIDMLPDAGSREVLRETFAWAKKYPTELGICFKGRKLLLNHYPNAASFTPMMVAIEKQSKYWKSPVKRIVHDQQSQFQSVWRDLHGIMGKAGDGAFGLIGGPETSLRAAPGSSFVIGNSASSAGIQLADLVLWLLQRSVAGDDLGPEATAFMERVKRHSEPFNMTYNDTIEVLEQNVAPLLAADFPEEDEKRGREIVKRFEEQRLQSMMEFEAEKEKPG